MSKSSDFRFTRSVGGGADRAMRPSLGTGLEPAGPMGKAADFVPPKMPKADAMALSGDGKSSRGRCAGRACSTGSAKGPSADSKKAVAPKSKGKARKPAV